LSSEARLLANRKTAVANVLDVLAERLTGRELDDEEKIAPAAIQSN